MKITRKITSLLLLLILSLALLLRFYQFSSNPKAMYGDGITLVYDAYSLYKTGHDQKGNFLPIVFSLGGGRPGGYVYATVPFVVLLGPSAYVAKLVSILSGVGIVLLTFLLGKMFFSPMVGLAAALVASINPWELSLSRGPFETHFALFLTLLGFYLFMKGLKKGYWLIFSGISLGLAIQTYYTYGLVIPLFVMWLLVLRKQFNLSGYLKKPIFLFFLIIIAASLIFTLYMMISRGSQDRFGIINIFTSPELRAEISAKVKNDRLLDILPSPISHMLHAPHTELAKTLAENYLSNLLPDFLFLHGDGQPRHNPAGMGEFFWVDAILLVVGLVYLYKFNKRILILLLGWILIAPLPTSLVGGAHALRSSFLLPPPVLIIGIGLWRLIIRRVRSKNFTVLILVVIIFFIQFIYFFDRFYFVAPKKYARLWSYPAKEAAYIASKNRQKFDLVILSNDIDNMEFAYPLYAKLDPTLVIKQNLSPAKIGEYAFFQYDNVYIGSVPNTRLKQFINDLPGSVLYIGAPKQEPYMENYKIIRGFDSEPDLVVSAKSQTPDLDFPLGAQW